MDKRINHCIGCENNFYNGNNDLGIQVCWSLENMTLIKRKEVHINQRPPWTQKPRMIPSCFNKKQYVYINCQEEDRQF
jgi:hypothetical protein